MRVMFLGERRIAQRAVQLICEPRFAKAIELTAMVTNAVFFEEFSRAYPEKRPQFIPNDRRRADDILAIVRDLRVDALVSVQHIWILPPKVLDAVEGRALNLHNARLPDYKGYNSVSHAILNGDVVFESTVHWMAEAVDSGDIAHVEATPIRAADTALSLYLRSVDAAARAFERLLTDLADGIPSPRTRLVGAGRFYARNELDVLKDVSGVTDPDELSRRTRAAWFPPLPPAFRLDSSGARVSLTPDGAERSAVLANAPNWSP